MLKAALPLLLVALGACSTRHIVEETTVNSGALRDTGAYAVAPLAIDFRPPQAWEIPADEWELWVAGWQVDYKKELLAECYKDLRFVDDKAGDGRAVVECRVYTMDKGGFAGFGGDGMARAHVVVRDAAGRTIYDGKLEGRGGNAAFESVTTQGRMKFSVLNIARQIADLLEDGR